MSTNAGSGIDAVDIRATPDELALSKLIIDICGSLPALLTLDVSLRSHQDYANPNYRL